MGEGNPGGGAHDRGDVPCLPRVTHRRGSELPGAVGKPWTLPVAVACRGPLSTHDCAGSKRATVQDGRPSPQHSLQVAGRLECQLLGRAPQSMGGGLPCSLHVSDKILSVSAQAGLPQTAWSPCTRRPGQGLLGVFSAMRGSQRAPLLGWIRSPDSQTGLCPSWG